MTFDEGVHAPLEVIGIERPFDPNCAGTQAKAASMSGIVDERVPCAPLYRCQWRGIRGNTSRDWSRQLQSDRFHVTSR